MKIHFFGAARTTTGSMYLIEVNGKKLLLECGLFQGRREESERLNRTLPFDPRQLDSVVVSHSHLDHVGKLPALCKNYDGPIHCTSATSDLCGIMLLDSAHIQEQDAMFVSKIRAEKHQPPVEPLYTTPDAEKCVKQFVAHDYEKPFEPVPGVTVTFRDAGHVLGSAQVILDVREQGRKFRYLFTGDIGRGNDDLLYDPKPVENVDYLQIESTYAARVHEQRPDADDLVAKAVGETLKQNGKVIIPAFAVGRTQQIVYVLHELTCAGKLPRAPIFVDSPLSLHATDIYKKHPESLRDTIYQALCGADNPFTMQNLTYITSVEDSKKLNERKEGMIIISASGMCEAGRVRHHLRNNISFPNNLVLFIGYCAPNTLGAKIVDGVNPVNIFGEPSQVRAKVISLDTYSGHADRNELKGYVKKLTGDIKKVVCIHGEEPQCLAHAETLRGMKPKAEIIVPKYTQVLEI
ncbi:MAG TPA: MBL fold metallo-hydrolase [Desulfuromonadaceae bacterium]|nr:MBL fold metallo-hydrolase [Desulfuromonadaceae bacterium]